MGRDSLTRGADDDQEHQEEEQPHGWPEAPPTPQEEELLLDPNEFPSCRSFVFAGVAHCLNPMCQFWYPPGPIGAGFLVNEEYLPPAWLQEFRVTEPDGSQDS